MSKIDTLSKACFFTLFLILIWGLSIRGCKNIQPHLEQSSQKEEDVTDFLGKFIAEDDKQKAAKEKARREEESRVVYNPAYSCKPFNQLLPVEKIICTNQRLSELDREMSDIYKRGLLALPQKQANSLRRDQDSWLSLDRNACDKHTGQNDKQSCIEGKYNDRIQWLKQFSYLTPTPKSASVPVQEIRETPESIAPTPHTEETELPRNNPSSYTAARPPFPLPPYLTKGQIDCREAAQGRDDYGNTVPLLVCSNGDSCAVYPANAPNQYLPIQWDTQGRWHNLTSQTVSYCSAPGY